jgi:hypothetical protein
MYALIIKHEFSSQTYVLYKKATQFWACVNGVSQNLAHWDFLPPASQRGNKVTLTPPPIFQGDFSNLFNSESKCLEKFMSSMYFIIFGILLDFTPQKGMKSQFRDPRFQNFPDPLDGLTPSAWGRPPPPAKIRFGYATGYSCTIIATKSWSYCLKLVKYSSS